MGLLNIMCANLLIAVLHTLMVCVLTAEYEDYNIGGCQFPQNPNVDALRKIQDLIGKSFRTTDENLPHPANTDGTPIQFYTYEVGVCSVPEGSSNQTAAIQYVAKSTAPVMLGSLSLTELMGGRNWVSLEYEGGKQYGSHCGNEGRRTILMMICNPSESTGILRIVEENNKKTEDCFYLFELEHKSLCSGSSSGLSVGSIVVIIFISLVAVYLIGGSIYQRFVVGAKGLEQIPNYHFWLDFGNLQADGCDLVCRCGKQRSSPSYHGVGDEQISNSLEEEYSSNPDDDLLPM